MGGAREAPPTCVRANVSLEQPRSREALAAVVALAALVVRAHVHGEGGHADVELVAVGAAARLFVRRAPVRLAVTREIARRAVPLAAVRALVLVVLLAVGRWRRRVRSIVDKLSTFFVLQFFFNK